MTGGGAPTTTPSPTLLSSQNTKLASSLLAPGASSFSAAQKPAAVGNAQPAVVCRTGRAGWRKARLRLVEPATPILVARPARYGRAYGLLRGLQSTRAKAGTYEPMTAMVMEKFSRQGGQCLWCNTLHNTGAS